MGPGVRGSRPPLPATHRHRTKEVFLFDADAERRIVGASYFIPFPSYIECDQKAEAVRRIAEERRGHCSQVLEQRSELLPPPTK